MKRDACIRPATAETNRAPAEAPGAGLPTPRLARERKTMAAMIACYCGDHHGTTGALCPECQVLSDYAATRLDRCHFGEHKPTCAKCPVHCYQSAWRDRIKIVMRYAGPRMLWRHPVLSLRHWVDGWRSRSLPTGGPGAG